MMNNEDLISVIIACHNGVPYIDDCLNSIVNQTYSNLEIIICDDCSNDGSLEKLREWEKKDSRIKVVANSEVLYAAASRNKCFEKAKGSYYMIQDIDDYSEPNRVERLLDAITKENVDFVSSPVSTFVDDINKATGVIRYKEYPTKYDFLWRISFNHPATMFSANCIKAVGGYRVSPETRRGQDFDLFMRLYASGFKGKNIQEVLYRYRVDADNYKRRSFAGRLGEIKIRERGYKALGIYYIGWLFAYKPLLAYLVQFLKKDML